MCSRVGVFKTPTRVIHPSPPPLFLPPRPSLFAWPCLFCTPTYSNSLCNGISQKLPTNLSGLDVCVCVCVCVFFKHRFSLKYFLKIFFAPLFCVNVPSIVSAKPHPSRIPSHHPHPTPSLSLSNRPFPLRKLTETSHRIRVPFFSPPPPLSPFTSPFPLSLRHHSAATPAVILLFSFSSGVLHCTAVPSYPPFFSSSLCTRDTHVWFRVIFFYHQRIQWRESSREGGGENPATERCTEENRERKICGQQLC